MANFSSTYPATKPVFQADFANGGRIDPRATFSRSDTPPTYAAPSAVHYWSNEKHLSSDNLLLQSSDFVTSWSGGGLSDRNTGQADPVGGTNATELVESGTADFHRVYQSVSATGDLALTVYAKRSSGSRYLNLAIMSSAAGPNGAGLATFDLSGGATHTSNGSSSTLTGLSATQTASGNGYYKCVFKATASAAAGTVYVSFSDSATPVANNYGMVYYTGDGTSSIDVAFASLSTTGATDYNATTTQIHREYAPTLKSVATAGAARFEYDPTDGQSAGTSLGCLIESQSTNLATYSSDITQSFYTGFRSTQESNVAVGPDGTLTADLLREDSTSGNSHGVYFEYASGGTTAQTISVYAKAAGRNHLSFRFDTTNGVFGSDFVWFNLSTGAVGTTDSDITASIESCGNGWYRCIATRTALASANGRIVLYLADADNSTSYNGNSYGGVLLWGIQAEANSSFASSYIKSNSGSTTTRAADSLSVVDSSLFDTGSGSLVVEAVVKSLNDGVAAWLGTDGNNYHQVGQFGSTTYPLISKADGIASAVLSSSAVSTGATHKVGASWDTNDFAGCVDGGTVVTDTSGTLPAVNKLTVGNYNAAAAWLDGHVKRVAIYNEALSDQNLQSLTAS